jgi:hypothetical protein
MEIGRVAIIKISAPSVAKYSTIPGFSSSAVKENNGKFMR